MCIKGNQKHKKQKTKSFRITSSLPWHVLLGLVCVSSQPSIHFYVMKTYSYVSCCFTHHEYLPFQSPKAMSILITKNILHQLNLEGKKCNLAFLGNKNFKDKNGNRPLDKHIGRAMIKILHSLNVQLKWDIKQQSTQSIIVLGGFIIWSKLLRC